MTNKLLPRYTWNNNNTYIFKIPMTLNGMKETKIRTKTYGGKGGWARLGGNEQSYLPSILRMKDIIFGVIYKDNEGEIDWYDSQQTLDSSEIDSFCFKGKAVLDTYDYNNIYNPYVKFNRWQLSNLLSNRRLQSSLHRIVEAYKESGVWHEMQDTRLSISEVTTKLTKQNMWKILTKNLSIKDFIVPNPALSLQLSGTQTDSLHSFNFLFTNDVRTERQTLTKWIKENPAAKPIHSADDWEDWLNSLSLEEREDAILENHEVIEEDTPF